MFYAARDPRRPADIERYNKALREEVDGGSNDDVIDDATEREKLKVDEELKKIAKVKNKRQRYIRSHLRR